MINIQYGILLSGNVLCGNGVDLSGNLICGMGSYQIYDGSTVVTPSQSTQVLYTANKRITSNITINPIPSNYGLITWNGSYLTVS